MDKLLYNAYVNILREELVRAWNCGGCLCPSPRRGVLIKVRKTAICGTDVHIYNWDPWAVEYIKPPMTIGHEYVGDGHGGGGHRPVAGPADVWRGAHLPGPVRQPRAD